LAVVLRHAKACAITSIVAKSPLRSKPLNERNGLFSTI
jgi:hypothetical protein